MTDPRFSDESFYSPAAEAAYLGACLCSGTYAHDARVLLASGLDLADFYRPSHRLVAEAVTSLFDVGSAIDSLTVAEWIARSYGKEQLDTIGGLVYLTHMQVETPATSNFRTYAGIILDRAARRKLHAMLTAALERTHDLAVPVPDVTDSLCDEATLIERPMTGNTERSPNLFEFLAEPVDYRWLVPGLLERGDRLILTAAVEGTGKSIVLGQMAVQFSAGIHPWRREVYDPIRVLLVDLENSRLQMHRRLERLASLVRDPDMQMSLEDARPPEPYDPDRLRICSRPQGVDLLRRSDRRWFTSKVEDARPDLIITGPIYKLRAGNPNDEEPAAELAAYFDHLRVAYDCAIMLEAHAPHATDGGKSRVLRPIGASLWLRWPEFGYGIRRTGDEAGVYDWVAWRGARDDGRSWPTRIRHGKVWPWVNDHLFYEEPPF